AFTVTVTPPEKPASDISLAFAVEAEGLRVSWPADFDGFVLETCRDLASAIWRAVDQVPVRDGGEWFVVIPTLESMGYFRLRK
ncbi:MAG TPA: hypothetical protein VGR78_19485, partial [Verrucomicrobiae bacterium]|nr:hypothetical protein [Verrucomicrobiae bacterium]